MREHITRIGPLDCIVVGEPERARVLAVLLHGYGMTPADLSPFAHSLGVAGAAFLFPRAPQAAAPGGFCWWSRGPRDRHGMDPKALEGTGPQTPAAQPALRSLPTATAASDLAYLYPRGRAEARSTLGELLRRVRATARQSPRVLLAGFSQGGMLACDALLMHAAEADALAMFSASRLALQEWRVRRQRLRGLPVFVSHGRADADLSFEAGERLKSFLCEAGASVTWVPFGSGHEIPLTVWRRFRGFLHGLLGGVHGAAAGRDVLADFGDAGGAGTGSCSAAVDAGGHPDDRESHITGRAPVEAA